MKIAGTIREAAVSIWLIIVMILLVCVVSSAPAVAQMQAKRMPFPNTALQPIPLHHIYWHFLLMQNHLDRKATAEEQASRDGSGWRNYFPTKLGFTDAQFFPIREAGLRLEPELKQIDAQVQAIVEAEHAQHPRQLASPSDLPPVPTELVQLQVQREAVIRREVARLRQQLGSRDAATLDTFLQRDFAPNITSRQNHPPRSHDLTKNPPPPFEPEVQP